MAAEFHWTDDDYGTITGLFSIFYAIANLFAGKFVDWMGTKKGYLIAIFVWSTGAVMHAGCGWVAMEIEGYDSIEALRMVQAGSDAAVAIATISVWLFLSCRLILAVGEAGNFPAAIKVTAEYFPKKDRAFSTAIFNSGASVGALAAPATIPLLARSMGWEWAFIIIGVLGYVWMGLWVWLYEKPSQSKHVNKAELTYIEQDEDMEKVEAEAEKAETAEASEEKTIGFLKCFSYRQTWSFIVGKLMTDGVWWFFLFWAPAYFSDQYGYSSDSGMSPALVIGHPTTLVVSVILIPVILAIAVFLPGNQFLPLASLAGMFYLFPLILPFTKGNVVKTLIIGLVALIIGLYFVTDMAPDFTMAANQVYAATGDNAAHIPDGFTGGALDFASSLFGWVIYRGVKLSYIGMGVLTIITIALLVLNRQRIVKEEKAAAKK
jgi:MFS family permease